MSDNDGSTNFLFFVVGAALGAAVALLYAPRSGKETRDYLNERAEEGKDYLKDRSKDLRAQADAYVEKGKEYVDKSKEVVSEQVERGKDLVAKQKEQLSAALDAAKEGYKEAKKAH
jgi:gas vesicle protein